MKDPANPTDSSNKIFRVIQDLDGADIDRVPSFLLEIVENDNPGDTFGEDRTQVVFGLDEYHLLHNYGREYFVPLGEALSPVAGTD